MSADASRATTAAGTGTGPSDDRELAHAAKGGDHRAFSELVDRYKSLVCAIAFEVTGSLSASEDIGQDVFVYCWAHLAEFREPFQFRNWVCLVARHVSLNFQRARKRAAAPDLRSVPDLASTEPSALDAIIGREEERVLWRALGQVPEPYRRALDLFYREGQSVERVATLLDVSPATIKMRLLRGRRLLGEHVLVVMEAAMKARPGRSFTAGVTAAILTARPDSAPACAASTARPRAILLGVAAAGLMLVGAYVTRTRAGASGNMGRAGGSPEAATAPLAVRGPARWPGGRQPPAIVSAALAGAGQVQVEDGSDHPEEEDTIFVDFEDGAAPRMLFNVGVVVSEPCAPGSRFCVMASLQPAYGVMQVELMAEGERYRRQQALFLYSEQLVLSFDYWLGPSTKTLHLLINDPGRGQNYDHHLTDPRHGQWTHVEIPLGEFTAPAAEHHRPERGDKITAVVIYSGEPRRWSEPFYLDNIRIARAAGRSGLCRTEVDISVGAGDPQ